MVARSVLPYRWSVLSPDARWLAAGSGDSTIRIWDLKSVEPAVEPLELRGHQAAVWKLALFSPDGHRIVTGSVDQTVRMWDLTARDPAASAVELTRLAADVSHLAISQDGNWLAAASVRSRDVHLWNLSSLDPIVSPPVLKGLGSGNYATALAFSNRSRWLATGTSDKTIRLCDMSARDPSSGSIVLSGHDDLIQKLAFSPDDRWLVSGSSDATARLWDLTAADPSADPIVLRGHKRAINSLAVSADGRRLATECVGNRTLWLWDLDPAVLVQRARNAVGRELTDAERTTYRLGELRSTAK